MSYYIQDSDSTLNGYPQVSDLFPDGVQSKSELVDFLDEAFAGVKNDPEIEGVVNWVSYWTGFNANAGTVYALSTEYANQIGYNGPTTAKTQNFILVLDKYIEQNVRELVVKMKKSQSVSKSFNDMVKSQRAKNKDIKKGTQHSPDTIVDMGDGKPFRLGDWRAREARDYQLMIDYLEKMSDKLSDFMWEGDFESADRFDGGAIKEVFGAIEDAIAECKMFRDQTLQGEWDPWF